MVLDVDMITHCVYIIYIRLRQHEGKQMTSDDFKKQTIDAANSADDAIREAWVAQVAFEKAINDSNDPDNDNTVISAKEAWINARKLVKSTSDILEASIIARQVDGRTKKIKMIKPMTYLGPGDIFNFAGAPEHVHTVSYRIYKLGGGIGMGEYPGITVISTTEGYRMSTDDWSAKIDVEIHNEKDEAVAEASKTQIPGWHVDRK
jgi:hypothetical protein